jgi:error-prone DNA polymerase
VFRAHELGYSALALTDECSMAGVVRAYEAAKECGLKLIVGSEFRTTDDLHVVLLAPTQAAYAQICALITLARRRSPKGEYRLARGDFEHDLGECLALWVPPAQPRMSIATWLRDLFPQRCWIAVELHRGADDAQRLARLRELAHATGLPMVAAGDVHMHVPERRALQDTVTAIRHRCTLAQAGHRLFPNGERHLRSFAALAAVYPSDLLEASARIAERCTFSLGSLRYHYPHELVPAGVDASTHLRNLTEAGLRERWPAGVPQKVRAAVEKELALVRELKYEHFFLTVHEIVHWARDPQRAILCQGRGSAANSVVCHALRITEVNPGQIDVLFERFISKERNEPPDIDVDFEHERREEVIQHIYEKYGRERTALAATVITYRARSAIRDIGKALGLGLDVVDRLAKAQAYWDNWEAFRAGLAQQGLDPDATVVRQLCARVKELLNFPRHLSQHVGGFVIAEEPISQLVPIENAAMPERTIIQWDKNDLEALGLLKVDVLALGMLTAMRRTFDLLREAGTGPVCMQDIPDDDKATYDMICRAETVGVFQIESRAQMSMLPRLRPRTYYDLVIEVAIVRPGPIQGGMVHPYLQRRRLPPEQVPYPNEELKEILKKTLGVPIFQEQVMQIAITAAGFSAGEADLLRRSMAAWNRTGTLERFRDKLLQGMAAKGYDPAFAERIYKQIEGFGEYGFPESHSASFALLTYYSSYLKCHRPAAFMAGLINSQPMGFYQPAQLLEEAKRQEVTILPVDVTMSDWNCTLEREANGKHALRLGMRLVRSLREEEGERIMAARRDGAFASIDDVSHRAALPKRATRALAMAGAFRGLAEHRNLAYWNALGVERLPGMLAGVETRESAPALPAPGEWEEILRDYRQLGLSTGRHPLALLRPQLRRLGCSRRRELDTMRNGHTVSVAGLVTHLQHPQTANGVIFASLEDETGINNVIIWPAVFEAFRHRILGTNLMIVTGELQSQEGVVHVVAERIEDYSHWVRAMPRNSRDFH